MPTVTGIQNIVDALSRNDDAIIDHIAKHNVRISQLETEVKAILNILENIVNVVERLQK